MYTEIDHTKTVVQITYANGALYKLDKSGSIWKWINKRPHGDNWEELCGPDDVVGITGTKDFLYKLHGNGKFFRYLGHEGEWIQVHDYHNLKTAIASDDCYYYILSSGAVAADSIMRPLETYDELKRKYDALKAQNDKGKSEIARLKGQLNTAEGQIQQLKQDRDQSNKREKALQDKIMALQKELATAQDAEKRLANELDDEKKREHEEWKKQQIHDTEDHKALALAHEENIKLQKQVHDLREEITDAVIPALQESIDALQSQVSGQQALVNILKIQQAEDEDH